jgi:hypothetical protein
MKAASSVQTLSGRMISVGVATAILAVFSVLRAGLTPQLGGHSPYMLFVAAVLVAGFARGGFCGLLVLISGGVVGFYFFADPQVGWDKAQGALGSLGLYGMVAGLVLLAAHELRSHVNDTFARFRMRLEQEAGTHKSG